MSREAADAISALRVNQALYAAIADGDLRGMDELWARDEPVLCIHPGGAPLQGRIAVMASWSEIFDGGAPPISYSQDSVSLIRGVAFVNCLEHLGDTTLAASNVLVWESSAWRIIQHTAGILTQAQEVSPPPSGPLH
ncbi:MAG: nuclear transport factor 2 family protein [Deltaproteobacteria bacterium]|nr:nuclear transport factor 2 family protein [Deltaproteobacteria bacterium]MBW2291087.1 nuclear transport factor 2 family protein [Deltaproteobacteria bacterium]MBW2390030.1 nuclear transport factor 2 family protein [Deltaproteobacteria bacterium]MBW2726397.1 nuclear transport factor 2 family protein [Deltaproteobacteria bacterium]